MSLIKKNRFWIFIVHVLDMPAEKTFSRTERCNDFTSHLNTSFLVMMPNSRPLCVTRVCLSPSFRNMSTTVSIGVWNIFLKKLTSLGWSLHLPGQWLWSGPDPQSSWAWGAGARCPPLGCAAWTRTESSQAETRAGTSHSQKPGAGPGGARIPPDTEILWGKIGLKLIITSIFSCLDTTTGKPLWSVFFKSCCNSATVVES